MTIRLYNPVWARCVLFAYVQQAISVVLSERELKARGKSLFFLFFFDEMLLKVVRRDKDGGR